MTPDDVLEQTQWDAFWLPAEATLVDRPELLYFSYPRDRPTLNCVARTRAPAAALPKLVDEVLRAHAGRRSRWLVRDRPDRPELERALAAAGYRPVVEHHVCTLAASTQLPVPAADFDVRPVADLAALRDFGSVCDRAFGPGPAPTDDELRQSLRECAGPGARVFRVVAYDGAGRPVSCGGMTHFPNLQFCLLWAGATVPEARRRGAYQAVLAARLRRARGLGAARAGLYAVVDTSAPILLKRGFERHGRMTYWERPP